MKKISICLLILLMTGMAYGKEVSKAYKILQSSYVVLDWADYSLTNLKLMQGGYREVNPVARWYLKKPLLAVAITFSVNVAIHKMTTHLYQHCKPAGYAILILANLVRVYVLYRGTK